MYVDIKDNISTKKNRTFLSKNIFYINYVVLFCPFPKLLMNGPSLVLAVAYLTLKAFSLFNNMP